MNRYQILFENYIEDLNSARNAALIWWQQLFDTEVQKTASLQTAEQNIRRRWPFGPASHPYVIAVYRKYFLACVKLNTQLEIEQHKTTQQTDLNDLEKNWGIVEDDVTLDDENWGEVWIIDPPTLLFEMLEEQNNELREFMTYFVYPCIGEKNGFPN